MPTCSDQSQAKSEQKINLYKKDWKDISDFFALIKGRSRLTKTAALREVIHKWADKEIRPALRKIRNPETHND